MSTQHTHTRSHVITAYAFSNIVKFIDYRTKHITIIIIVCHRNGTLMRRVVSRVGNTESDLVIFYSPLVSGGYTCY